MFVLNEPRQEHSSQVLFFTREKSPLLNCLLCVNVYFYVTILLYCEYTILYHPFSSS